jgi:hypothetical protein
MRTQLTKFIGGLLLAGLLALPELVQAQPTAHYAPGTEGLKAASLPPPGVYLRDYNEFYYSDHLNDAGGHSIGTADPRVYVYAQVPRLIWITDQQILGGYLGVDALLPLEYTEIKANTPGGLYHDQTFGIGDFFAEGTWSKHIQQFDFSLGYGWWMPTGDSSGKPASVPSTMAGLGYWGQMLTVGATWYVDADKKWSLSALNRYEFNYHKDDAGMTPGQAYTVEGGLGYAFTKTIEGGVVGYYQQQVTGDDGLAATQRAHGRVAAIGPEIGVTIPSAMLGITLRYEYEILAESRFQGNTFALTLTKRF